MESYEKSEASRRGIPDREFTLIGWQERFLAGLLRVATILGLIAYLPSVWLSLKEDLHLIAAVDTLVFAAIVYLNFTSRISHSARSAIVSAICFVVGLLLFMTLGPFGGGPIWLFAFPMLAGTLLGSRAALASMGLNLVVLLFVGVMLFGGWLQWDGTVNDPVAAWLVIAVNFILMNGVTTYAVMSMLTGLNAALKEERGLKTSIQAQATAIEETNTNLKAEVIERRNKEALLAASEEKYRLLAENTADIIWVVDTKGRFVYVNNSSTRLLGYSPDECIGMLPEDMCREQERANLQQQAAEIRRALKGGGQAAISFRTTLLTSTGGELPLDVVASAWTDGPGNLRGYQGVARDQTQLLKAEKERAELQKQLHQAMRLETVGRLAGGVAHDFNNLLTVTLAHIGFLEESTSLSDENRSDLRQVRESSERAARLTSQLLAFSRKQIMQPRTVDLRVLISELLKLVGRILGEDILLSFKPRSESCIVHVDPAQMEQVLMNLVVNARDAMPGGGHLTVDARHVVVDDEMATTMAWAKPGIFVEMSVTDTGSGMSQEVKERVFEPFFTTKETGKGTGLGLSTVFGIITQHGGFVDISSRPEAGTRVSAYLPVAQKVPVQPQERLLSPARGTGETILVVEDEEAVRHIAVRILRRSGYRVLHAANGADALETVRSMTEPVQLAILDVVMPGMGGGELQDRLRELQPDIPILFCSGYSPDDAIAPNATSGGSRLLPKPYRPEDLLRAVRRCLTGTNGEG